MTTSRAYVEWDKFIQKLVSLEHKAHAIGLHVTARQLNEAVRAAGYERAGQIERKRKEK